jgi:WD40 repeat protein
MQLISVSNRFIVYDLTSGDVIKVVVPQIEGIMQTLSVSPDRKYCVSYSNNDQIVIWGTIGNETKTLNKQKVYQNITTSQPTLVNHNSKSKSKKPIQKIEKDEKIEIKDTFLGIFTGNSYFVAWSKCHFYLYSIKGKLIVTEKVEFPLIQIEILSNESINCCGIELEIVIRAEDCKDDEDKDRDYMFLEYRCIIDIDKLKNQPDCADHQSLSHYIPHSNKISLHNALVLNKAKNKLYTCIEISDNFVECFRNKHEFYRKSKSKRKIWKYNSTLDENKDRIYALLLSENEMYMLAVVVWGFKVFYLKTGQSKPLKLPTNIKNIQIGYKKLFFSAVFSKDNQYVVAGVRDKIFMWDTSYGTLIKILDAHYGRITSILGSGNEQKDLILSSSMDKTIKIWNLQNIMEEEFQLERLDKPVEILHVSSIASFALAQTRTQLVLISLKDGRIKNNLCHNPHGAIFNCSSLATNGTFAVSSESNKIILWDLDEIKVTFISDPIQQHIQVKQLTFHNSDINFLCSSIDTTTKIVSIINYAIPDGESLYKIEFGLKNITDYKNFVITTDENYIVAFRNDKKIDSISLFKTEDGSLFHSVKLQYANYINSFFLVPMVAHPHYIALIDVEKGNIINTREKKFLRSIQKWNGKFTKDDKFGFYAPNRGGLEVLDLKHGEKVKTLIPKIAEGVFEIDVAITEDDKHVIYYHSGRRNIRAFRLLDGKQIADFKCPAKVKCMKTAQDSKSVIIGCEDGTLNMLIISDPYYSECVSYLENWRNEQVLVFEKNIGKYSILFSK